MFWAGEAQAGMELLQLLIYGVVLGAIALGAIGVSLTFRILALPTSLMAI